MRLLWVAVLTLCFACGAPAGDDAGIPGVDAGGRADAGPIDAGAEDAGEADAGEVDAGDVDAGESDAGAADAGAVDAGMPDAGPVDAGVLNVDRSNPQLYRFNFTAADADPAASLALGAELGTLDTRVPSKGLLVVHLHGAGAPTNCGASSHHDFLAARGFHVIAPCYVSDYGVGNCGADIGGCRLEAFDGVDRTSVIAIAPPDSIQTRVVRMLQRLQTLNPKGDWQYFLAGGQPRWDRIVISGISHGASSAGVIAKVRPVARAVMLSGPLDTNQAWLTMPGLTPASGQWGFTHKQDPQHPGHVAAFGALQLPGALTSVDAVASPYAGSHRLFTDAGATDPHSSTQAGGASPKLADGGYVFAPVWEALYGAP